MPEVFTVKESNTTGNPWTIFEEKEKKKQRKGKKKTEKKKCASRWSYEKDEIRELNGFKFPAISRRQLISYLTRIDRSLCKFFP